MLMRSKLIIVWQTSAKTARLLSVLASMIECIQRWISVNGLTTPPPHSQKSSLALNVNITIQTQSNAIMIRDYDLLILAIQSACGARGQKGGKNERIKTVSILWANTSS